jgi:hypothetical protein
MTPITAYFNTEHAESLVFIAAGVIALALALWAWRVKRTPFWRGAAWPLALIAAIQLVVGGTIFQRSRQDLARVQQIVAQDKARIVGEEVPRMQTVMKSFALYRWIEIALLAAGLALLALAARSSLWQGVGAGLAVQASLMLLLDFFAEQRGQVYLDWLRTL